MHIHGTAKTLAGQLLAFTPALTLKLSHITVRLSSEFGGSVRHFT